MYLEIIESALIESLFDKPNHPYTEALLLAIPILGPNKVRDKIQLKGEIPSLLNPPSGCAFSYTMSFYNRDMPIC